MCLTTDTTDVRRPSEEGDTQFGDLPLKTLLKPDEVGRFLGVSSSRFTAGITSD